MVKPTSYILTALRRTLAGLSKVDEKQQLLAVLDEQAGLVVRLAKAAEQFTGEDDSDAIVSALVIGLCDARSLHSCGKKLGFSLTFLATLRAARVLGLRHKLGGFAPAARTAMASVYLDDDEALEIGSAETLQGGSLLWTTSPETAFLLCDSVSRINKIEYSARMALADIEEQSAAESARHSGVTDRAIRYRKAKARAAALHQGDLFGEVE